VRDAPLAEHAACSGFALNRSCTTRSSAPPIRSPSPYRLRKLDRVAVEGRPRKAARDEREPLVRPARKAARRERSGQLSPPIRWRSKTIRVGETTPRGYVEADLVDVWERYLPSLDKSTTCATKVIDWTAASSAISKRYAEIGGLPHRVADGADFGRKGGAHCHQTDGLFCETSLGGEPIHLHVGCKDAFRP